MPGGEIVIKQSDEGWWILLMICTITVTRNPAARTNCRSQRWSRRLVHRRGAGPAFVRARPVTASSAILESADCLRETGSCRAPVIPSPAWRHPLVSFRSLSVGDRTLQVQRCSTCRQIQGYTFHTRQNSDGQAIGADPQVIAPALASLLDDAAGKVITLAVSADMDRTLIIPSHHLPVFVVEPDR